MWADMSEDEADFEAPPSPTSPADVLSPTSPAVEPQESKEEQKSPAQVAQNSKSPDDETSEERSPAEEKVPRVQQLQSQCQQQHRQWQQHSWGPGSGSWCQHQPVYHAQGSWNWDAQSQQWQWQWTENGKKVGGWAWKAQRGDNRFARNRVGSRPDGAEAPEGLGERWDTRGFVSQLARSARRANERAEELRTEVQRLQEEARQVRQRSGGGR